MADEFELFGRHRADSPVVVGGESPCTAAQLLGRATAIANRIPAEHRGAVLLDVVSRGGFATGMLAAWMRGLPVLLAPPGGNADDEDLAEARAGAWSVRTADIDEAASASKLLPPPSGVLRFAPEQALVTLWTSGSTGQPQAHRKTARQLIGEANVLRETFAIESDVRVLATAPPQHVYGLLFGVVLPLVSGASFVDASPLQPTAVASTLRANRANTLVSVPAHLRALAALGEGELISVARVFSSAAPLQWSTSERLRTRHGLGVVEVFGSTETGGIAWREQTTADAHWKALPGVSVSTDPRSCLTVGSPFLPLGSDAWVTGDQIELVGEGSFVHRGRIDGIVKIGGKRVALLELERALLDIEGVRDAAVAVRHVGGARQYEIAALVVADAADAERLREALLVRFDPVVVPRRIVVVDRVPRAGNGKVSKAAVFAQWEPRS